MVSYTDMVTINDVAKAAGVSKGTVDRVLHNRGEVSSKSREKVLRVNARISEEEDHLLYHPGICRRRLLVQVLIAQHSDRQAASAVLSITDKFVFGKDVAKKDNFTQMDILNKINCDYYM